MFSCDGARRHGGARRRAIGRRGHVVVDARRGVHGGSSWTHGGGGRGENEYGNVASQIGGKYVSVYSVDSNPNTDPHTYEATPSVGQKIASANLLIENGVGYDTFMGTLASASPNSARKVINVQHLLGLPDSTANPHLWYDPRTMPAVASALASDLSALDPAHASTFRANERKFVASLQPWLGAIAAFKAKYGGTTAATTEPVADYLLTAMGIKNLTPWQFQADIMNGTDPTPQDVSLEQGFLHEASGEGVLLQPAGHRPAHGFDPPDRPAGQSAGRRGVRNDARSPGTTTSRG